MKLLLILLLITIVEHLVQLHLSPTETWYVALGAKYLSLSITLNYILYWIEKENLLCRSLIALTCIWTWVDFIGYCVWGLLQYDLSITILSIWSVWLILTLRRVYDYAGDAILGDNIFIMLLRPTSILAICKALIGFPTTSICIYAQESVWSYRAKTGTFDTYSVDDRWLKKHIGINTNIKCTDDFVYKINQLCGISRFPGIKCVWTIRKILALLGTQFIPKWYEYIPGLYAMRIINRNKKNA